PFRVFLDQTSHLTAHADEFLRDLLADLVASCGPFADARQLFRGEQIPVPRPGLPAPQELGAAAQPAPHLSRHVRVDGRVGSILAPLQHVDDLMQELRGSFGWLLVAHDRMKPGRASRARPGSRPPYSTPSARSSACRAPE